MRQILLAGLLVGADQGTKYFAAARIPGVVNSGFSLGIGRSVAPVFFVALLGIVIVDSIRRGAKFPDILIISGGISNVADRIIHRGVIDWIRVQSMWFNLSDAMITIGVLWILLFSMRTTTSSS